MSCLVRMYVYIYARMYVCTYVHTGPYSPPALKPDACTAKTPLSRNESPFPLPFTMRTAHMPKIFKPKPERADFQYFLVSTVTFSVSTEITHAVFGTRIPVSEPGSRFWEPGSRF